MRCLRMSVLVLCACGPGKADSDEGTGGSGTGTESAGHSSTPTSGVPGEVSLSVPTLPGSTTDDGRTTEAPTVTGDGGGGMPADLGFADCSPWLEDCPVGEKCMPVLAFGGEQWDAWRCRPVAAEPAPIGSGCLIDDSLFSGIDDCPFHAMCWSVNDQLKNGFCAAMCTGAPDLPVCPEGKTCAQWVDGLVNLCLDPCNPLNPGCEPGDVCVPLPGQRFVCAPRGPGPGHIFDPCDILNGCDAGFVCATPQISDGCDPQQAGCCMPVCDTTEVNPSCPFDLPCTPIFGDDPPPDLADVGICGAQI